MIGKSIYIYGKVQGVGFRYSAISRAKNLNITGFVKNQPDGSVYIEAFGDNANLNRFLQWCYSGPPLAKVLKVETADIPLVNFNSFSAK